MAESILVSGLSWRDVCARCGHSWSEHTYLSMFGTSYDAQCRQCKCPLFERKPEQAR